MVVVAEQDYYYSDSDSDDEDVDRYVFLARQPAPPGRHAEDDRDASSSDDDGDDDDGDGTAGEEESEGGVGKRRKRPFREIMDDDAPPPPTKKAQVEVIIASPLAAQTQPSGSESNLASSPRAGESGSEGSHESHEKACEHRRDPREHGEAKNATKKKRGACGKRSGSPGCEADGDRDDAAAAAKTGAPSGAASGRFPCSLCDRCFDSHQALGGHVLGHRKRTKIAIAAAILDADDVGEQSAAVEVTEEAANRTAQVDKDVAAARRGEVKGSSDEGKTVDDAAEHGDEDADKGNGGVGEAVFAGSHDDANGNDGFGVSGHGFTDGNSRNAGKMDIGTASPNRKVVVAGTCHEGANGNGNGNVCRTRYKCKVCGTECLTGRALGGHMRKHRKRPPVGGGGGGGGEERSPSPATDDDCQIPLAQLFGAETSLQREI